MHIIRIPIMHTLIITDTLITMATRTDIMATPIRIIIMGIGIISSLLKNSSFLKNWTW